MKYKINFISGFRFEFTEIADVFNVLINETNSRKDVATITSYNESKVKILLSFLVECGLIKKRTFEVTSLGKIIRQYDRFMENDGTLWLIHYIITSQHHLVVWNRLFNNVLDEVVKDRETIMRHYVDLKDLMSEYTFERNVRKEIKMVLDTYINERLSKIDLIDYYYNGYCCRKNGDIPDLVLLSSIIYFRDNYYSGSTTIGIKDLCCLDNSPGRICFLDESYIRNKLEHLKNLGLLGLESRADLDQVRLGNDLTVESVMEEYYKSI